MPFPWQVATKWPFTNTHTYKLRNYFSGRVKEGCCSRVRVERGSDSTKAYAVHPGLYTTYYLKPDTHNGRAYYEGYGPESGPGSILYAIWYTKDGSWLVSHWMNRAMDEIKGHAVNFGDDACPDKMGYDWQYSLGSKCGGGWADAGNSLTVTCV